MLTRGTAPAIDARDFLRRYFVFRDVPPGEPHEDRIGGCHPDRDQPPDVPDQREASDGREESSDESDRAVAGYLNRFVGRLRRQLLPLDGEALDLPVRLLPSHIRQHREIESRRGRCGRPFERAAVPGIAGFVAQGVAPANADHELDNLRDGADQQDDDTQPGDENPWAPGRDFIVLQAARHSQQARDVERDEGHVKSDQSAPEGDFPPPFMQPETECLGEPVGNAGKAGKQHAADDDIVEMRHQEKTVVQLEISRRNGKQNAGHAADDEGDDESHRPEHRRRIADRPPTW